jgi:hypothetical protein
MLQQSKRMLTILAATVAVTLLWGEMTTSLAAEVIDLETFDDGNVDEYTGVLKSYPEVPPEQVSVTAAAAHDGLYGLRYRGQFGNWILRDDADVHVEQGDILSVWIRADGYAGGRGYFGFGATLSGTLTMAMAPNTGQLLLQESTNRYRHFQTIGSAPQTWEADRWYRMEVTWETDGTITGRLYDADGTTQLNTVTATSTDITSGGIAFRSFERGKSFDTVQVIKGGAVGPGITVTPIAGLVTSEDGTYDTFSVVLDTEPTDNVTIGISSSDTLEGTVSPASLIFTPTDWNLAQTVTVTGVDDADVDGDIVYTILTAAAVSTDTAYDEFDPADVSVTNLDNESPAGLTVTSIDPDTVSVGTSIDVIISGSGFAAGASVTFTGGAGRAPKASNIVVEGDGLIVATISAHRKAKASIWDLVITNTDGSTGACVACFALTP